MIASDCSMEAFLKTLNGTDYKDLLYTAEKEAVSAERLLYRGNVDPTRRETCGREYVQLLKHFICYMRYGCRPRGIEQTIFDQFRAIRERVARHPAPLFDRNEFDCECDTIATA
jgi:hypothetical protein